jgi:hypothetical protein
MLRAVKKAVGAPILDVSSLGIVRPNETTLGTLAIKAKCASRP